MSYKDTRIIDFIEFNPKLALKKGTVARKIPMENLAPFTRDVYSNTYELYNGGAKFQNKDTIVARITPSLENGKTAFINHLNKDEIAFGSTEFIVLRAISGVSYPQFVYYFSTSTLFRDNAIASMTGTSGRQRVQENTLYDLIYRLPSLDKQKAIANILSSLDDKIELNNTINKNLEELAQTLYKQWFVDFEFPNEDGEPYKSSGGEMVESELGLIPRGWYVDLLGNVVNITYGKNLPTKNLLLKGYPVFGGNGIIGYNDKFLYKNPKVLVSCRGAASGSVLNSLKNSFVTNNSLILEDNEKISYEYLKELSKNRSYLDFVSGSAQPQVTIASISQCKIIIPKRKTLNEFRKVMKASNEIIENLYYENLKLAQLRDELLPKLMSGEIEVPIEE